MKSMRKQIKAVQPYIHPGYLNFKSKPFKAWKELDGKVVDGWYPRYLHWILSKCDFFYGLKMFNFLPREKGARLVFIQPINLYMDVGPSVLSYEVIPFFWDCWPRFYDKVELWLKRHKIKTAVFTCKETYKYFKYKFPSLNVIYCYEGIDSFSYIKGENLINRKVDILEFGRGASNLIDWNITTPILHICTKVNDKFLYTDDELHNIMSDSKISICFPQSITNIAKSGGIETLTQRYWECMLSRIVMVGHCPQELIDIIGYNPVIELETSNNNKYKQEQVIQILENINNYQHLVDNNYSEAIKYCDWKIRINDLKNELKRYGYNS